ncbi:MerR family DNA-binding transcriptional regulator [Saccharopolyspora spinosa]|uniref:MerR-like DNA binding protein n=1 Tax=Saccharopolyspora spinosa TaxID=60894 RepID=A0A2N3XR71_SACSN|nr:MerR family DNA-binding transcriptional regulator [Saccharopolyspora spinosa]PKW13132.1 MerR-like DNA binding protein [Saccharopolyspora spinosa]
MTRNRLLTSGELARELGISPRTVARYVRLNLLTPTETTLGGHYRWDLDEVREQIKKLREQNSHGEDLDGFHDQAHE